MPNDPLDNLLQTWNPSQECSRDFHERFQSAVWNRIAAAEATSEAFTEQVDANAASPVIGLWPNRWLGVAAALAICAVGVLTGFLTKPDSLAADRAAYLADINPMAMPTHHGH